MYNYGNYGYHGDRSNTLSTQQRYDGGNDKYRNSRDEQVVRRYPGGRDTSPGQPKTTDKSWRTLHSTPNTHDEPNVQDRSRSNDQALDNDKDSWDYLDAEMDLSPRLGNGRMSGPNLQQYDTGTGQTRPQARTPGTSYHGYGTQPHSQSSNQLSPARDDLDRSTASRDSTREYSDPSTGTPRKEEQNVNRNNTMDQPISKVSHADIHQSVMSYRERWERSRRDRDSLHLNRSSSEPNRDLNRSRQDSTASVFSGNHDNTRSRSYDCADRNRSILSANRDLDLNRSIADKRSMLSGGHMDNSNTGSLRRDPVTHRKIPTSHQNGMAKPIRDSTSNLSQSRNSLTRSRSSLSKSSSPKVTLYGQDYGVHNSLVSMALYSILSLVLCALGMQLLLRLSTREAEGLLTRDSVLQSNDSYKNVQAVAVTFSSAVVMLNLCCLLTCSLQCFFAAKLVKCPQGEERAFKYIKECTGTRSIAVSGFFISIPVFLLAFMLYVLLEYRATAAIIAVVIATIGISFTISTMVHSTYFWRVEKAKADNNIAPYSIEETGKKKGTENTLSQSELSTLV